MALEAFPSQLLMRRALNMMLHGQWPDNAQGGLLMGSWLTQHLAVDGPADISSGSCLIIH